MLPIFSKLAWLRTMILVWAMTWTIVVPLFHVHPEADHRHGNGNHVHGGTVHTVFSPDLECEYTNEVHDPTCPEGEHRLFQARAHSGHAFNHPEIEFSLLTGPDDRPLPKPVVTASRLPVVETTTAEWAVTVASLQPGTSDTILFLSTALPLRAPPSQSL